MSVCLSASFSPPHPPLPIMIKSVLCFLFIAIFLSPLTCLYYQFESHQYIQLVMIPIRIKINIIIIPPQSQQHMAQHYLEAMICFCKDNNYSINTYPNGYVSRLDCIHSFSVQVSQSAQWYGFRPLQFLCLPFSGHTSQRNVIPYS